MSLESALVYSGLAAAVVTFTASQSRGVAAIALLAAGLQTLIHLGVLRLGIGQLPLGLVFGIAIALPALIVWFRAAGKAAVSASAIATFIGLVQLVRYVFPRA